MAIEKQDRTEVAAVIKALRLLEAFQPGSPELPLTELVRRGGYSKSTTYRLLKTLESAGWLEQTPSSQFRLTIRPFQVGSILVDSLELRQEAGVLMADLAAKHADTVFLIIPSNGYAVCIERIEGGSVALLDLNVGGSIQFHLGAGPKVLLAFREDELLPQLVDQGLTARTEVSLTELDALRAELAEIRRVGYALSVGDVTPGIGAVGAPVRDRTGTAVAALSISGLVDRYLPGAVGPLAEAIQQASATLSVRLGYAGRRLP